MLKLSSVYTSYGSVPVLKDVTMEIPPGEITCLLGSNGAGKTTTIRAILGLIHPTAGEITFQGKLITGLPTEKIVKQGIAVVPEGRRIFPKMTVYENLLIGACNIHDKAVIKAEQEKVFARFPLLAERMNQNAGTLSGGEQQMLAIGRALMGKPQIMLLDEPSLGLSPLLVGQIFSTLTEINREGMTILLIEQNGFKALAVSNRAYLLQKGRIVMASTDANPETKQRIRDIYLRGRNKGVKDDA